MGSIKRSISKKVDQTGKAEILLRINIDRTHQQRIKSGIYITASRFRDGEIIKPRANQKELQELNKTESELKDIENFILKLCQDYEAEILTKDFFIGAIESFRHPEKAEETPKGNFFVAFNEYIDTSGLSQTRLNNYRVLLRAMARYEAYKRKTAPKFNLSFENIDEKTLTAFVSFLKDEPTIFDKYPDLYDEIPAITRTQRKPKRPLPRGNNAISSILKRFRAFYNWAIKKGYTNNYPFAKFTMTAEQYGTPFYLSIEERNKLANFDFNKRPALATQRDIFIFQCLTGCRVSDLYRLTPASVMNGAIEYIPTKTKGERPEVVRVPLNQQAKEILSRYETQSEKPLLPFISSQKYNDAIKEMLKIAGINRIVTILNPTTGEEEKKPINEVASSHMARRTFIGNLYKKVKDPNLVGSLSGHKEGSKAFARYREIDDEIKRELIELI